MTCSKKILIVSYICGIILTIITVIGCFIGYDMTVIGTITGIAYGEISVSKYCLSRTVGKHFNF